MTQLTLRLVPHDKTQVCFIIWKQSPETIKFHDDGVVTLFCPDGKGVGLTFVAEYLGDHPILGRCVEVFVGNELLRSLLSLVLKANSSFTMPEAGLNYLSDLEAAWAARLVRESDSGAMHRMIYAIGEAYGKRLAASKLPPDKFKQVRRANCQWADGPMEYDGFVGTWKDAVGEGYDRR